jgi:hypothetical protein
MSVSPTTSRGRGVLAVAALASGAFTSPAHASPPLFGVGARSTGLAGTGTATVDNYESTYLNPAGLASARKEVSLGTMVSGLATRIDGEYSNVDPRLGAVLGISFKMPFASWLKDRVGVGLYLYQPRGAIGRLNEPFRGQPSFALLDKPPQTASIQGGVGIRVTDRLHVGVGGRVLAGLTGDLTIETTTEEELVVAGELQAVTDIAPVVGLRYVSPRLQLGLAGRAESSPEFSIHADASLEEVIGNFSLPLVIAGLVNYEPAMVDAEAALLVGKGLLLSAQASLQRWSTFEVPLRNPVEGKEEPDPNFSDTVVPRISAEWTQPLRSATLALRAGYAFVMSPAPEMTGELSVLDNHRQMVSAGAGVAWQVGGRGMRADAWLQGHHLLRRTHTKDPELVMEPAFDRIDTGGLLIGGGLVLGVEL